MIIAIEGIDGAGKKTQIKLIKRHLKAEGAKPCILKTPNYKSPVGKLIREYLTGKAKLEPKEAFLVYSADVLALSRRLRDAQRKSKFVLLDRYITSTIAYQCGRGLAFKDAVGMAEILQVPKVDKVIFIDIKPETGFRRKKKQKPKLDIHERDIEYLSRVRRSYLRQAKEGLFGDWIVVDGEKPPEDVKNEILKAIRV
jgi:dTMP kinase